MTGRTAEYAFKPGLDERVALVTGTQAIASTRFFHQDRLGNIIGVTSGTSVSQQLRYNPWGAIEHSSGSLADTNKIRWKGLLWEADSTQLYFMRNRWYDPAQRRFVNEDPLGLLAGLNRYVFGEGDAINARDPTALQEEFEINVAYDKSLVGCPRIYRGTWPSIGRVYTFELKRITSFWRSLFGTAEYQGEMTLWMPDNYGILTETRTVGGTAYCRTGAGVFNESNVAFP